jgi:hypothetical protein
MGYLNNQIVTVDAILTTKGRELLARGDGSFNIKAFALSDDEIDYTLYNPTQPSGSAYYGEAIENMPLLEAFPDETQMMKYLLTTLPRDTAKMPVLDLGTQVIQMPQTSQQTFQPQTLNYLGNNSTFESSGYVFTVSDARMFSSVIGSGLSTVEAKSLNSTTTNGTNVSKTVTGTSLTLTATGINTLFGTTATALYGTLTVTGRDSGARIQIPINVTKTSR